MVPPMLNIVGCKNSSPSNSSGKLPPVNTTYTEGTDRSLSCGGPIKFYRNKMVAFYVLSPLGFIKYIQFGFEFAQKWFNQIIVIP